MPETALRVAVDIGGTFTDVVLEWDAARLTRKVLTTPQRPEEGLLAGMRAGLADAGFGFADIGVFIHGTTLATNALIQRRGARTALIATDGFRDVIEIANEGRYDQYDLQIERPPPLVPRSLRFVVPERVDVGGGVRLALDEAAVEALVPVLREAAVESVAIAYIHGYANPGHERRTAAILRAALPDLRITLASEACPEIREYERTSTAVTNAYVQPLMASYLTRMEAALGLEGFSGLAYLVTSGGGLTSVETARRFPVRLVESGPAGGAIFAARMASRLGEAKVLSFDMGGTTAKICLIEDGTPATSRVFEVDRAARFLKGSGLPLRIPVIEMVEIGAGGGSLAQVDALQRVTVGPDSAGSEPGPACYSRGGTRPAVTDADLALGLIAPDGFAGGRMTLRPDLSKAALAEHVGGPLGLSSELAAYAVHETVCENMASAARVHAVERGADIAAYTLIAFGGAAPLHAARVAEKIGVARVVVPPNAGVGSAVGFLAAPIAFETVRSRHTTLDAFDPDAITRLLDAMTSEARAIVTPGAAGAPVLIRRTAYMRYVGQGHEIAVALAAGPLEADHVAALRSAYETEYARLFARFIPGAAIEVLTWAVLATTEPARPPAIAPLAEVGASASPSGRRALFDGRRGDWINLPVYERGAVAAGARIPGPAIIVEDETATFVSARFDARVDGAGCIVMDRKVA